MTESSPWHPPLGICTSRSMPRKCYPGVIIALVYPSLCSWDREGAAESQSDGMQCLKNRMLRRQTAIGLVCCV